MKRRTLPAVAAFASAAALLLSACGSDDDSPKEKDPIAGAETGDGESASPSATASKDTERPSVSLPGDVKNVFQNWKDTDAVSDAVLSDTRERINATDAAITNNDPESPAVPFYYEGKALLDAAKWITGYTGDNYTFTGTTRYFLPSVTKNGSTKASVSYCSDETKVFDKDRKTEKLDKSTPSDDSYVYYKAQLVKNKTGIWQTTQLASERGNKKCTP
ncbi:MULTISPECIES: hypothetical protein [Streptomyces]|uniref:Lipoprotein n=1 Tax=Streptomyces albus (strain ATCC 21838 / DSM 41398 / FERM P-419 / JCM 4703 / NBRC 107858) TaxID=1081613 RepID=A0A0B5EV18_STRA4|nr:hypothetical protein [Streptomyces sp. SCSIO ZS0520]AJE83085.1 lipoprotein [Streptomyces albus]AOU77394.1 lipoprotein [Streptomyces albus]AYN33168.1 hypothetical protein DUI70_2667 [Streptomyces albus]